MYRGRCSGCPKDYGYEETEKCDKAETNEEICTKCWNREIPEVKCEEESKILLQKIKTLEEENEKLKRKLKITVEILELVSVTFNNLCKFP